MKYKLRLDLRLDLGFVTLYRIERLSDKVLGGYIEKEENLSQVDGDAWVYGNAKVYGNAQVSGNAKVSGDAQVYGDAWVYGNANVSGNAKVYGNAQVSGNANVSGDAQVYGDALVYGDAWVYGDAQISSIKHLIHYQIGFKFNITITPDNISIGCLLKKRLEWLKVTKKEAEALELPKELYPHYKQLIKTGMKLVPSRKKLNRLEGK